MNIVKDLTSVNYSAGRIDWVNGKATPRVPSYVIIHTQDGYQQGTRAWFKNPAAKASTHYLVGLDGNVIYMVEEGNTAWGAGDWGWNTKSIQIELEDNRNPADPHRTAAQYETAAKLTADICRRYGIPADRIRVLGHREVNPRKPHCPGGANVDRIANRATEILRGVNAVVLPAPAGISETPWTGRVNIVNSVLQVREAPNVGARGFMANTPDGLLHAGQYADIVAYAVSQDPYNDGRNIWLKSFRGKWLWAGGTDFKLNQPALAPPPPPAEPIVTPPVAGSITLPESTSELNTEVTQPTEQNSSSTEQAPEQPAEPEQGISKVTFAPRWVKTKELALVVNVDSDTEVEWVPTDTKFQVVGYIQKGNQFFFQTPKMATTSNGIPSAYLVQATPPQVDSIARPVEDTPVTVPKELISLEDLSGNVSRIWIGILKFLHLIHKKK